MASINRIAKVEISLATTSINQQSFSDLLILAELPETAARVFLVTSADELLDHGVQLNDDLYRAVQTVFQQSRAINQVYIGRVTVDEDGLPAETITEALVAIKATNSGWYGVIQLSRDAEDILEVAAWIEANDKLQLVSSSDADILTMGTTDIASRLKAFNYNRTALWYHANASTEWLEAALAADRFTYNPGGETWANVRLSGVQTDSLSEGESQILRSKNANSYEQFRNLGLTQYGTVASGEWIDIIRFRDWLKDRVQTGVVDVLAKADGKIPYTSAGIQVLVSAVRAALDAGVVAGGIAPKETDSSEVVLESYRVTYPSLSEIADSAKSRRLLEGVKFTARLAGAIHTTEITGVLSYSI
jgi:hypothetical protein